ncbi:hypothetical protein VKI21_17445 [Cyanobacterium aponinum UTEX 3222]|uniref:hypothetical protein n=1 Tax=Cyanobacterium aponinum TaxID=379064 RepID=UPI00308DCE8B|nr:hypothetical protein VKI21_17445 [Cyanobacterium aponinum UTEX 3222]
MVKLHLKSLLVFLLMMFTSSGIWFLQNQYTKKYLQAENIELDYFQQEKELATALALQKKMPTLGFANLLADWQYLQFIQYFGDSKAREETGYSLVTDYFQLISKYDPNFVDAYFILSTANSIYAGQPEETVTLLNQILSRLSPEINPNAFLLWNYKAVDEILFLGDIEEAKKSYLKAVDWISMEDDKELKPVADRISETVKFLENNPDSKKAQVSAWLTVLNGVFDDKTRQMAIDKIKSLGGDVIIENGKINVKLPEND